MQPHPLGRSPPAWRHGLSSRHARERLSEDAEVLAKALLGSYPSGPALHLAGRNFALAEMHLRSVREVRRSLLDDRARSETREGASPAPTTLATGLRQLNEYERKAFSRRAKSLRALDYEMIEAERRRRRSLGV
jgi:hypothetical protein